MARCFVLFSPRASMTSWPILTRRNTRTSSNCSGRRENVTTGNGELHGFTSLNQLLEDGFDPAMVVTVPGLGTAPVAASSAGAAHITALSTRADGALVASGHTYYVFAGGRALPVPTPADLATLRHTDTARPLVGTVGPADTGASMAGGVLLSVHTRGVYVSYRGEFFPFRSMAQISSDGYEGAAAVPVPGTGTLPVIYPYSGS